jgi:hypothetical protein
MKRDSIRGTWSDPHRSRTKDRFLHLPDVASFPVVDRRGPHLIRAFAHTERLAPHLVNELDMERLGLDALDRDGLDRCL